jgi:CRISPR-associated protein (TIGR03985 family)
MPIPIFDFPPNIDLLQILGRGSLKQCLAKAVRQWVILSWFYGDEALTTNAQLDSLFSLKQWSEQFFSDAENYHTDRNKAPTNHSSQCVCAKTLSEWLFDPTTGVEHEAWRQSFLELYPIGDEALNHLLCHGIMPKKAQRDGRIPERPFPLPDSRLFAVTGATLENDFDDLVEMGWLKSFQEQEGKKKTKFYSKAEKFPYTPDTEMNSTGSFISIDDLSSLIDRYARPINGEQRFFLDVEYIVSSQISDDMEDLQDNLKQIWEQAPVSPIKLSYCSASLYQEIVGCIVYPVCICYFQRAPYLFAYGQTPQDLDSLDWYSYRLDRIQDLEELSWSFINLAIPQLQQECFSKTPDYVRQQMAEAVGFDFYQPKSLMLIRFDRYFYANYIENTERTTTFKCISYHEAENLILGAKHETYESKQALLSLLKSRSQQDIYCKAHYRVNDNNVIMRLRAWGPKVEVLFPTDLRKRMTDDMRDTWKLYSEEN